MARDPARRPAYRARAGCPGRDAASGSLPGARRRSAPRAGPADKLALLLGTARRKAVEVRQRIGVGRDPRRPEAGTLRELIEDFLEHAVELLRDVERRDDRVNVFGAGKGAFSGWSRSKQRLDGRCKLTAPWTLHDLRRSFVTHLVELGTPPHVVEAAVNHVSGHKGGVAGIYNRAT